MTTVGPSLPERRDALLHAARVVLGENGPVGAAYVDPQLATALAEALAEDMGHQVEARTAAVRSVDELVEALVDAVVDRANAWRDGLPMANAAMERVQDFDAWSRIVAPWVAAIERSIAEAQQRGLVRADLDARSAALVLRDALDRTAKAAILFGRDGYRETATRLVRSALSA